MTLSQLWLQRMIKKTLLGEKGKSQEGNITQGGKCYILGKFYTSTPTVVNAENLIYLNSYED